MPEQNAPTPTNKPELNVAYDFANADEAHYLHRLDERVHQSPKTFVTLAENAVATPQINFDTQSPRPKEDAWLFGFAASSRGSRLFELDDSTEDVIDEDQIIQDWIIRKRNSGKTAEQEIAAKIRARRLGLYAERVMQIAQPKVVIDLTDATVPRQGNAALRTSA